MLFRKFLLVFVTGLVFWGAMAKAAPDLDVCAFEIEGARLGMGQGEIATIWSATGFERYQSRRERSMAPYLKFTWPQGGERQDFVWQVKWNDLSHTPRANGAAYYAMEIWYRPPQDKAHLQAYNQMVTDKAQEWCDWAASKLAMMGERKSAIMGQSQHKLFVLGCAAPTTMGADGVVRVSPGLRELPQIWDGCNWVVTGLGSGEFYMRVTGPKSSNGQ